MPGARPLTPALRAAAAALPARPSLAAAIKLRRTHDALAAARALGTPDAWQQVAAAAVQALDVRLATAAFRQAGDAAMVLALGSLEGVEDRNLLAGSLLVLLGRDFDQAQVRAWVGGVGARSAAHTLDWRR